MKRNNAFILLLCAGFLLALSLSACTSKRKLITSNGLYGLRLGSDMPVSGLDRLHGHSVRDTFVDEGGFQWRQVVMDYRKGWVYLEEDFYSAGQLWRIRVVTPDLSLRNGLHVGMQVKDLQAKAKDWVLTPLPDFNLIDAYSLTMPRIHFLVDDPAISKTGNWEDYKIDQLAALARIVMIVVL